METGLCMDNSVCQYFLLLIRKEAYHKKCVEYKSDETENLDKNMFLLRTNRVLALGFWEAWFSKNLKFE